MGLTGFGVFFLLFGMMLFFDKALLAIGNVSYFIKYTCIISPTGVLQVHPSFLFTDSFRLWAVVCHWLGADV